MLTKSRGAGFICNMTTEKNNERETREAADAERKMEQMKEALEEMKALDIAVLNVRAQTTLADYFVVCTGTSDTHLRSIAEHVRDEMREKERVRARPEGGSDSFWIVLDYGDIILHIFDEETREFYDIEHLWTEYSAAEEETPSEEAPSEEVEV